MSVGTVLQNGAWGAGVPGFFLASGSLWLGVVNWRHTRGQAEREDQRSARNDLRELLFDVKSDLKSACKTLGFADDLPEQPPSIQKLKDAIPRYKQIVETPTESSLSHLDSMLVPCSTMWALVRGRVEDAKREHPIHDDPQGRKRASIEAQAKDVFQKTIEKFIDPMIDDIKRANRQ
jgi:hypothetical protein